MNIQLLKISNGAALTLFALMLPSAALASSITLAPASVSTTEGKSFSVTISVNPTSGKAYTVRANLSFDPAAVTFTGFTFAPKWMQLPQEGYDVENNVTGALAKTGGYPGGITAPTVLGTATFRAKSSGVTTLAGTADSLILDANNANSVSGSQGSVQVSIAAASVPAVTTAPAPTQEPDANTDVTATLTTEEIGEEATATSVPQVAAALSPFENVITFGTGSPAVASLVTVVALLFIGGGIWLWRRESSQV